MTDHTSRLQIDKQEIIDEFISKMQSKFKKEEAQGIIFTLGMYISDIGVGIIVKIDNGTIDFVTTGRDQVEMCDIALVAPLEIYNKLEQKEMVVTDIKVSDDDQVQFFGDMALVYELYNIFDILV